MVRCLLKDLPIILTYCSVIVKNKALMMLIKTYFLQHNRRTQCTPFFTLATSTRMLDNNKLHLILVWSRRFHYTQTKQDFLWQFRCHAFFLLRCQRANRCNTFFVYKYICFVVYQFIPYEGMIIFNLSLQQSRIQTAYIAASNFNWS